jgi:Na+-transporting methylmalonyl-CoA/oxaloacetate decarboxylase gamma subunit
MMENINQGLLISLYGIGITFLVLASVILLIKFLLALFPAKTTAVVQEAETKTDPNIPHVVAFAAAWWQAQRRDKSLGRRLQEPPGKWWHRTDQEH